MDQEKFKESVAVNYRPMYAAAALILRDSESAADAVQDAMVSLWNARARLDQVDNIKAYCIMVAKNKALDALKKSGCGSFDPIPENFDVASPSDSLPSSAIEQKQQTARLKQIINNLPDNQRRVMILSAMRNLSNNEIASATGLSDQNVRVLLCRARQRVRQLYIESSNNRNYGHYQSI